MRFATRLRLRVECTSMHKTAMMPSVFQSCGHDKLLHRLNQCAWAVALSAGCGCQCSG